MIRVKRFFVFAFSLFLSQNISLYVAHSAGSSSEKYEFWPGATYDPAIPTIKQILGHAPGEEITSHGDMIRYFEALAKAAPDRLKITEYATSWQGRKLIYMALSSPKNISNLDSLRTGMKQLRDPRKTDQKTAEQLIKTLPATLWLGYAVHGNEISSTDAAMLSAYHLLAATNDPRTENILESTVVFIDPLQNPDGRDRFIHQFQTARGLLADSSTLSAEHNEPWPKGRGNHYLFDMNRDWFALTQPETIGRIKALKEWYPLVFVDLHEMNGNSSYYFSPEAIPFNPHIHKDQKENLKLFGHNNAKWFDKFGDDYFTREIFDAFYPGYGASWPSYYGAIAMTYEQASARGLVFHRTDGEDLKYRETVRHHFVTSLSSAEVVANNREKFLRDFYTYQKTAVAEGKQEKVKSYIIPAQFDQMAADKIAGLLVQQDVEVMQADKAFKACGTPYAAGSYVISAAQPAKRFIRTMLDQNVPMKKPFLKEQERRRAKDLSDEIYDVTAWSLPLMFNVKSHTCSQNPKGSFHAAGPELFKPATLDKPNAKVAFLVPWGQVGATRLLSHALRQGLLVKSNDKAFTSEGREYPSGSLIFEVADNGADLGKALTALATLTGAPVYGVDSSWITKGPNFGSGNVVKMHAPRVAIAWDEPTSSLSAGNTRYVIERQFDYPVSAIRVAQLARADLSRFQVLILPQQAGSYKDALGKKGTENLKDWVKKGGTLIALGTAMRYATHPDVDLLSTRREDAVKKHRPETAKKKTNTVQGSLLTSMESFVEATSPIKESPDAVSGVLARGQVDKEHWLSAGLADQLNILVTGRDIYQPIRLDKGRNIVRFKGPDDLLISGYLWEENRKQLAYKPFVVVQPSGRGHVIGFTNDPTTRAYLDGLNIILANSIFRAAAHSKPLR